MASLSNVIAIHPLGTLTIWSNSQEPGSREQSPHSYKLLYIISWNALWEYTVSVYVVKSVTLSLRPAVLVSWLWCGETFLEFTGLPLHGLLCWEWEATLRTTREWRALESIFVVNCGVCLFVREGQSGFEYVLNYVLCVWMCGFGEGIWCVCSLFLFFLLCSVFFSLLRKRFLKYHIKTHHLKG